MVKQRSFQEEIVIGDFTFSSSPIVHPSIMFPQAFFKDFLVGCLLNVNTTCYIPCTLFWYPKMPKMMEIYNDTEHGQGMSISE